MSQLRGTSWGPVAASFVLAEDDGHHQQFDDTGLGAIAESPIVVDAVLFPVDKASRATPGER